MTYYDSFDCERSIEEVAEELYFNDEWLDELDDEDFDDFPDEDFWTHCDELEADEDFLPDREEIPEYAYSCYFEYYD